jgi:K+-transporting ATPase KdpF subunit
VRADRRGEVPNFLEIQRRSAVAAAAMTWLAGLCAAGLTVYLFYALVKPERF